MSRTTMPEQALPFPLPVVPPRFTPLTAAVQNRRFAQKLYNDFFNWPIERSRKIIETTPPEVWEREGQKRALQVFHAAAQLFGLVLRWEYFTFGIAVVNQR